MIGCTGLILGSLLLAPPAVASSARPAEETSATRNSTFVGASWVSESEWNAFDDRPATDVLLEYRRNVPKMALGLAVTGEGRFGRERIPLVNDAPGDAPRGVRESRYVVGLGGTWTRGLFRRGTTALEAGAGLGYRLEFHDNALAPYVVGFAGPGFELTARRGPARAIVGLEAGFPLHDSSPSTLSAGPIEGRLGWTAQVRWAAAVDAELVAGFRGEAMDRKHARRSSESFLAGVSVGF